MSELANIKRAVEAEKTKKVQGESKLQSLREESARLYKEVEEQTGEKVTTAEEVERLAANLREEIEANIVRMRKILETEGISYR